MSQPSWVCLMSNLDNLRDLLDIKDIMSFLSRKFDIKEQVAVVIVTC